METLCCTEKYRRLFGMPRTLPAAELSEETALGPWYANVLNIGSARLLHYISATSLLSVVIPQRERKTAEKRFGEGLFELLDALGVPMDFTDAEMAAQRSFTYARATDRSVLASMRDQANSVRWEIGRPVTVLELALILSETPCGPMDYDSPARVAPRLLRKRWGLQSA